jgi:SAM-dependent methyltransferase
VDPDAFRDRMFQLLADVEVVAAVAAWVRVRREGLEVPDELRARLDRVVEAAGFDPAPEGVERMMLGFTRAFLRQASGLIDDPGRAVGWRHADAVTVRGMGQGSAVVADALRVAAQDRPAVAEALARAGSAILDVGTGAGGLARALVRTFPAARVVGIDLSPVAIEIARTDLADLADRVEVRVQDAADPVDREAYDLAWLPGPFLPGEVVPAVLAATHGALRPGGMVAFGTFGNAPTPLGASLADLRTVRAGGRCWTADELVAALEGGGFREVAPVAPRWSGPTALVTGLR